MISYLQKIASPLNINQFEQLLKFAPANLKKIINQIITRGYAQGRNVDAIQKEILDTVKPHLKDKPEFWIPF